MKLLPVSTLPYVLLALIALGPAARAVASDALIDEKKAPNEALKPPTPAETEKPTAPRKSDAAAARDRKADSGSDEKQQRGSSQPAASEDRPPVKLQIDTKPIDRNAPDRVSYAPVVRRTAASVVYVYSNKKVPARDISPLLNDPRFRRFFESIPGHQGRGGRIPERNQRGLGSGVVITRDGYILTNNHVVEDADEIHVVIGESTKRYDAKVIGRDSPTDIAVLKIDPEGDLIPAVIGDSDQLQVGDVVLAIGNPFGIGQSVSRGIVSALGRNQLGIEELEDFIQTDAAINPGNSGGALLDTQGRVVGINTAILSSTGGFAGVGLAIPINLVRFVTEQIVSKGRVERGFLGVSTQDITEEMISTFGAERGALVNEVTPDSPAEKGGLKAGDVITKIDDTEIRDQRHLQMVVTQMLPGKEVTVHYLRDGKPATLRTKLGLRPNRFGDAGDSGGGAGEGSDVGVLNGVSVADLTPEMREQLKVPPRIQGAIITGIDPESPSAQQGLLEGDIIVQLDRQPTPNAEEAVRLSEEIKGPKVMVLVWRNGANRFLVIDESKK